MAIGDMVQVLFNQNIGDDNFVYQNEDAIGLGVAIVEPGFAAAWDVVRANATAYTKGATNMAKG